MHEARSDDVAKREREVVRHRDEVFAMLRHVTFLRQLGRQVASSPSSWSAARAFHATPPRLLAWASRNQPHAPPTKWRWDAEPGQVAGAPRSSLRAEPRRPGEKSFNQKLDEARIERGERPRRLIKTRKRIALARHTHIARFRLRRGPQPREPYAWEDPERATREAMVQFIDPYELDPDLAPPGRRWHAAEIRLKSNEDLQKLWVVLMRERNMLHSTRMMHRKQKTSMPHRIRIAETRKSMAMIRIVLNERQLAKRERDTRIKKEFRKEKVRGRRHPNARDCAAPRPSERDSLLTTRAARSSQALGSLDLPSGSVWAPWLPGGDRLMPIAQKLTFNVVLRTLDGSPPAVRPDAEHLTLSMTVDGEPVPASKLQTHVVLRPAAPSRPDEMCYACHVMLAGDVLPRDRFLESPTKLREGAHVEAQLSAALYGLEVGDSSVPVLISPSRRLKRRVKLAEINRTMSAALQEAREQAAKEAGVELPTPSPTPPPTEYWKPLNPPLM